MLLTPCCGSTNFLLMYVHEWWLCLRQGKEPHDSLDGRKADAIAISDDDCNSNSNNISVSGVGSIHMHTSESVQEGDGDLESASTVEVTAAGSGQPYQLESIVVHKAIDYDGSEGHDKDSDEAIHRSNNDLHEGALTQPERVSEEGGEDESGYRSQHNFAVSNPMLKSTGKKSTT